MKNRLKSFILTALVTLASINAQAQVDNYCLDFTGTDGIANLGAISTFSDNSSYTLQFWVCPTVWTKGACIVRCGTFSIKLGNNHSLVLNDGSNHLTLTHSALGADKWCHVTVRGNRSANTTEVTLNNSATFSGETCLTLPAQSYSLWLGGGFKGRLDEVRLWKCVLPTDYNSFWNNTLNKYVPKWSSLSGYWKMDHPECPNLVNYKYNPSPVGSNPTRVGSGVHGTLSGGVHRAKVTDNENLRYLLTLAYDNLDHIYSRSINSDLYGTLANHVSLLAGYGTDSGHAYLNSGCEMGTVSAGGEYVESLSFRTGVLHLTTEEATLSLPAEVLPSSATNFTIEMWYWIDEWKEGATLLEKRVSDSELLTLTLGAEEDGIIYLNYNGKEKQLNTLRKAGRWYFLGLTNETLGLSGEVGLAGAPMVFGKGLKCHFDNICIRKDTRTSDEMATDQKTPTQMGAGTSYYTLLGLYEFELPEYLGFDAYSIPGYYRQLRQSAGNLDGQTFTITFHQMQMNDLSGTMSNASKRQTMAQDLINIINLPYVDGIDIDYEWFYNTAGWNYIAQMVKLVRQGAQKGKIISVTPHNVTYAYPTSGFDDVDFFLFQQYGPQSTHSYYSTFTSYCQKFINYGFPKEKIIPSYATISDNGGGAGTIGYNWNANNIAEDDDHFEYNGHSYVMNSLRQVEQRTIYARDNGLGGIFYWDMCNDVDPSSGTKSMSRQSSMYINSNVQPRVTEVANPAPTAADDTAGPIVTDDPEDQGQEVEESVQLMTLDELNASKKAVNIINTKGLGIIYSNPQQTNMWLGESSNSTMGQKVDHDSDNASWMVVQNNGKWYMYNVGRQEFAKLPTVATQTQPATFTAEALPIDITCDGNGTFTFRLSSESNEKGFLCASPQLNGKPVCHWTATDDGSTWKIVTSPMVDGEKAYATLTAMLDYAANQEEYNNNNKVSTLSEVDNNSAYCVINATGLGIVYANPSQSALWLAESSNSNFSSSVNHFGDNSLFLLLESEGEYYLYSVGRHAFVTVPSFNVTSQACSFSDDPVALEVTNANGCFTFRNKGSENAKDYMCAAPHLTSAPVAQWTKDDNGSQWNLVKFAGYDASAVAQEALRKITATAVHPVSVAQAKPSGIYNLSGQRVSRPRRGVYIINGQKVVR